MTDTVKLIIEIDEHLYKRLKSCDYSGNTSVATALCAVANGTPLDDVKAEIVDKAIKDANGEGFIFLGRLLRIFDNIAKSESEDK